MPGPRGRAFYLDEPPWPGHGIWGKPQLPKNHATGSVGSPESFACGTTRFSGRDVDTEDLHWSGKRAPSGRVPCLTPG